MSNNLRQVYPDLIANGSRNSLDDYTASWNNSSLMTANGTATPATTTTILSSGSDSGSNPNMVLTGVLMGIVASFTLILCYLTVPSAVQWLRRRVPVSPARLQLRYETIEGWLISKRVRAHCDTCEELQAQFGTSANTKLPRIKLAASYDTAETVLEEEGRECPVCMESFVENDIVSWSPSVQCDHVFHHSCIKRWLLHHECCPYCRVTVLPVDRDADAATADGSASAADSVMTIFLGVTATSSVKPKWTVPQLTELAQQRARHSMTTYYCLQEGLVTLNRPPPAAVGKDGDATNDKCKKVPLLMTPGMKRFLSPDIRQGELAEMRGGSNKGGANDEGSGDEDIVVVSLVPTNDDQDDENAATTSGNVSSSPPHTLRFADAVVDIETCMMQLRVISNHGRGDAEEESDSSSSR